MAMVNVGVLIAKDDNPADIASTLSVNPKLVVFLARDAVHLHASLGM
jgi:hypothetical protein